MIKFFRQIRYKLMSENKSGKYIKYAIGEIILVVIGILIALKVNDWNETYKQLRQENMYLIKLNDDLQDMKDIIEYTNKLDPEFIMDAQKALHYVQQCDENAPGKEHLDKTLLTHGNLRNILIKEATYTEMLANGAFTRLQNDSLKSAISNLYSLLHNSNEYISYFRAELGRASMIIWEHTEKEFLPDVELDYNSQDQLVAKYNYIELCQSGAFKNALAEVYDARQDVYQSSSFLAIELESVLNLLNEETRDD